MVPLSTVHTQNIALVQSRPLVAVFVGATGGIGENTLRALTRIHGTSGRGLRVYLVGRSSTKALHLIAACQADCPDGQFHFVQTSDLSLLKEVDSVYAEITSIETTQYAAERPRVDILCMGQSWLGFDGRHETPEGLDALLSINAYGRMRFAHNLLPLLRAAEVPARVISVWAAGLEDKLDVEDLSLRKKGKYGFLAMRSHGIHLQNFYFERLVRENAGRLSFCHYFPSLVITDGFLHADQNQHLPGWFKWFVRWFLPLFRLLGVSAEENGERVLYLASGHYPAAGEASEAEKGPAKAVTGMDGKPGSGSYSVHWNNESTKQKAVTKRLREQGVSEKVWRHVNKAFAEIEAGRPFRE